MQGECILVFLPGIEPIADVQEDLEHANAKPGDTPLQVTPPPSVFPSSLDLQCRVPECCAMSMVFSGSRA